MLNVQTLNYSAEFSVPLKPCSDLPWNIDSAMINCLGKHWSSAAFLWKQMGRYLGVQRP